MGFNSAPNNNQNKPFDEGEYIKKRTEELRKHIIDTHLKFQELYDRGKIVRGESWNSIGADANAKNIFAINKLDENVAQNVWAHGIGSNVPTTTQDGKQMTQEQMNNFPLKALSNVLINGELKGYSAPLRGGISVFVSAPFLLVSNKGEELCSRKGEKQYIKNIRAVVVNGQYEGLIPDLKKRFPNVDFISSEQLSDSTFNEKKPEFVSLNEIANKEVSAKINDELKSMKK